MATQGAPMITTANSSSPILTIQPTLLSHQHQPPSIPQTQQPLVEPNQQIIHNTTTQQPTVITINDNSNPPTESPTTQTTPQSKPTASGASSTTTAPVVILNKQRLQELVQEIDPSEQLDEDVEDMLLQMADDFIENIVTSSCQIAKHRGSTTLDVKDVQLILEKNWNMWLPGFGSSPLSDELRPLFKKTLSTEAHKQRLSLIKKTLKKF